MSDDKQMAEPDRGSDRGGQDGTGPGKGAGAGQSGGGPYPNPHTDNPADSHEFDGGQSDRAYYGGKQLGDRTLGDQPNAPSEEE